MSRFLDEMSASSGQRVAQAKSRESTAMLEQRARAQPRPPPLRLSTQRFDVIAELKLRSPAMGALGSHQDDWRGRVRAYAGGGAAAVSVLTEPSRFDGSLAHLREAALALRLFDVPAMRKDFLIDPYQILEARAEGAGGVLVIVRMLSEMQIGELLDCASAHGLFVLLEAFDADDLALAAKILQDRKPVADHVLIGVNCRDLQTLAVIPERFEALAALLPQAWPGVAESGVTNAADAQRMARLGYRLALVGGALMSHADPTSLLIDMLQSARTVQS